MDAEGFGCEREDDGLDEERDDAVDGHYDTDFLDCEA